MTEVGAAVTGFWGASRVIAVDSDKFRLTKALEFGATDAGPGMWSTTSRQIATE